MSVTLIKQPQDLSPVYNQMIIALTGSYQTQPNHNFVSTLFVNGVQVSKLKVPTNPEGYGVFDIHKHVENRISFDFNPNGVGLSIATNSFATYSMTFAEEFRYEFEFFDNAFITGSFVGFIGPSGGSQPLFNVGATISVNQTPPFTNASYEGNSTITSIEFITASNAWLIGTNKSFGDSTPPEGGIITLANYQLTTISSTTSITKKFGWNGVYGFVPFIDYNQNDFIPDAATPSKWLSNVPQGWEMFEDDRMWLLAYKTADNQQKDLMVETNRGVFRITSPYSTSVSSNDPYRFIHAAVGPWNLINGTSSFQVIGTATFPIIDADTKEYKVFYRNQILQQDTETLTFKIKRKCSRYEPVQLIFLDKRGSFIPFTFNLVSRQNKNMVRTNYQEIFGSYAPASQGWNYNSWDRGKKNLNTSVTDVFTITSDWVNQLTSDFLMELFESPEVYYTDENGLTTAIIITTNSVEKKKTINDQIINYTLQFELSYKNNQQKG
jgi:hypothetical protein